MIGVVMAFVCDVGWYERHVEPSFCIARPTWPWQLLRALTVAVAALLLLVLRPWLGRRLARVSRRELMRTGLGVVVALVAALAVGELVLRRARWDDDLGGDGCPEVQTDARLDWSLAPSRILSHAGSGRSFGYVVNARGERVPRPGDTGYPDRPTLVVAGESIAFGTGLDWDDTFGAMAGRALGLEVVNLGVPTYSSGQTYLHLVDRLPRLAQPQIVVVTFVARQIRRNISPARSHFALDGSGSFVPVPAATGLGALRLARLFGDEPYHGDDPIALTRAILVATAKAIRARGGEPLFLITNYGRPCRDADPPIQLELFAGLPHIRVDLGSGDTLGGWDLHPNATGSHKLAAAIVDAVRGR